MFVAGSGHEKKKNQSPSQAASEKRVKRSNQKNETIKEKEGVLSIIFMNKGKMKKKKKDAHYEGLLACGDVTVSPSIRFSSTKGTKPVSHNFDT